MLSNMWSHLNAVNAFFHISASDASSVSVCSYEEGNERNYLLPNELITRILSYTSKQFCLDTAPLVCYQLYKVSQPFLLQCRPLAPLICKVGAYLRKGIMEDSPAFYACTFKEGSSDLALCKIKLLERIPSNFFDIWTKELSESALLGSAFNICTSLQRFVAQGILLDPSQVEISWSTMTPKSFAVAENIYQFIKSITMESPYYTKMTSKILELIPASALRSGIIDLLFPLTLFEGGIEVDCKENKVSNVYFCENVLLIENLVSFFNALEMKTWERIAAALLSYKVHILLGNPPDLLLLKETLLTTLSGEEKTAITKIMAQFEAKIGYTVDEMIKEIMLYDTIWKSAHDDLIENLPELDFEIAQSCKRKIVQQLAKIPFKFEFSKSLFFTVGCVDRQNYAAGSIEYSWTDYKIKPFCSTHVCNGLSWLAERITLDSRFFV